MNILPHITLGVLAGGGAGYVAATLASPAEAEPEYGVTSEAELIAQLQNDVRELREQLAQPAVVAPDAQRTSATPEADFEALIDRWMSENLAEHVGDLVGEAGIGAAEGGGGVIRTAEEAILAMQAAEDWDEQQAALKAAHDAGILDEVIAELERRAESQPDNESAHMDLAAGYLQKLFTTTNPIESGTWAMKLDQTYDKALVINEQSWDARFGKAMSLSNWPDFTGKKSEAIRQFEILREQQRSAPNTPGYDQTYLILGNMYQQQGQLDKAQAAWQEGLDRFPDHAQLREQLSGGM